MSALTTTWLRLNRRLDRVPALNRARPAARDAVLASLAPGRTVLDVGCMWNADGRAMWLAADHGASAVTGVDLIGATPAFEARRGRTTIPVRFVCGDVHDADVRDRLGPHDIVWCTGVVYHAPDPLATLAALRELTAGTLVLGSETLPLRRGGDAVYYPALPERRRRAYAAAAPGQAIGLTTPYDPDQGYGNWFWGFSPSALEQLVRAAGFEVLESHRSRFYTLIVARRTPPRGQPPRRAELRRAA